MFRRAPWWLYVVAASFVVFFGMMTTLTVTTPLIGIVVDGNTVVVTTVLAHSAAETAGMRAGDRILGVDGHPIQSRGDWIVAQANVTAERATTFHIERNGVQLQVSLTPERASWSDRRPLDRIRFIISRSGAFIMLGAACLLAFSGPKNPTTLIGALLLACIAIISNTPPTGSAAVWRNLPAPIGLLIWIPGLAQLLASAFLCTFCAIFPRKLIRTTSQWVLIWTPAVLATGVFARFSYHVVYDPANAFGLLPESLLLGIQIVFLAYFVAGIGALALNYRLLTETADKRRVRVLVFGVGVGITAALVQSVPSLLPFAQTKLIRDVLESVPSQVVTSSLVYWFFPLCFVYAVLRHRLFDIRIIIRHGLQYALARRGLLTLMPVLAGIFILDLFAHSEESLAAIVRSRGWFYAGLAGLAAVVYTKRQVWLDAIDRRFFRDRYDAQRLLREVIEEVKEKHHLDTVSLSVLQKVNAALHPQFVALLVRHDKQDDFLPAACLPHERAIPHLKANTKLMQLLNIAAKPLQISSASQWLADEAGAYRDIDLLVPIDPNAILMLGPKRSEEPYSREDESLLSTIAASLAILPRQEATPVSHRTAANRLMNRYRLDECIGRGGMGAVYAGFDEALDRPVAIKLIRQDLVTDPGLVERFRHEAKAVASITHRNVVTIYDFGVEGDQPFIVMELLTGRTLRAEMESNKTLSEARTLEILNAVCDAVEEAHERRLIHRDLKPENIFLAKTASGEVIKVLDFGLAKAVAVSVSNAPTAASLIAGTPSYMAPEQLMGEPPSPSWDLWALGVIAYEMLTGQRPSLGDVTVPSALPRWSPFFAQALNPDPRRRFPNVRAFRAGFSEQTL